MSLPQVQVWILCQMKRSFCLMSSWYMTWRSFESPSSFGPWTSDFIVSAGLRSIVLKKDRLKDCCAHDILFAKEYNLHSSLRLMALSTAKKKWIIKNKSIKEAQESTKITQCLMACWQVKNCLSNMSYLICLNFFWLYYCIKTKSKLNT